MPWWQLLSAITSSLESSLLEVTALGLCRLCTNYLSSSSTCGSYCEIGGHADIFVAVGKQPIRIKPLRNVCLQTLPDFSTELRWASFCLKYSDFMYFEQGWKEERCVNSLLAGHPQLGSAFSPQWAAMWLIILFSPQILAFGYHSTRCLAYFAEGLCSSNIVPLSTVPLWYLIDVF